jgi:hypothetical protein
LGQVQVEAASRVAVMGQPGLATVTRTGDLGIVRAEVRRVDPSRMAREQLVDSGRDTGVLVWCDEPARDA